MQRNVIFYLKMWLACLFVLNFGLVTSSEKPSIFDMYPQPYTRRVEMLTDSVDVEQINPVAESLTPQYIPEKHIIAVTADYDEKYVERKLKFRKTQSDKLLDAGFKLKKRFTLSDMYIKSYERKGNEIPHFDYTKAINDNSSKDYNLSNKNINGISTISNKNSFNDNAVKDKGSSGKKKKIKILFDDVENNMYIKDTISSSKSSDWEPVAYEGLDLLTASMYSTGQTVTSIPILWESLHYDGVEDLASVEAKISANKKINVRVDSTSTENNLKIQSNEIVTRTELVTKITSQNLGKAVQKDNKEEDDDDIEVFKPGYTKETNTRKNNKFTKSTDELKQVTVGKYNLKENMDLENLLLSKLNTTYISNSNEVETIIKPSRTDSTKSQSDFNIIELLKQTTTGSQESQRSELKIDSQNNKIKQVIPQDLVDDVEEIMKLEKLDTKDVEPNLLPSTIDDDTTKEFRPFRTTDDLFFNGKFPVLNDTTRNKNFSSLFMNDSFIPEKSDIFFHDLLAGDNQRDITTNKVPTLTMNGPRLANAAKSIKKYPPTLKEKVFVKYINRTKPTEKSYEPLLIEDHSIPVIDDHQVSRLVYKYKQSLSSIAPKRIEINTGTVPKQTLPVIDYDYLLYNQLSENTVPPEKRKKTTRENFNVLNVNPEHDGKFEWNDYNNYDEVLSNDESEITKWQKVLPLQLPKKKSTTNVIPHYPRLSSLGNHYTLHTKPPRTTSAIILTTQKLMKKNVPDKRVFHLKIRRNSTFPNSKSTNKTSYMFDGVDDILGINNWIDDHGADYYESVDKPVTDPSTLQPRDIMFRRVIYPFKKQTQKLKRSIKSTLFDELFKTQNFTHLVTLIWHKNSSNKAYKNMLQQIKYGKERQKRECKPFIIETGKHSNIQSVVSVDNDTITCNDHKVMTATSSTEESNTKTTEIQKTTFVKDSETVKSENRSSRVKPLLHKYLLLEGNQPVSKLAKYKKKSQVKLGNIWRFMANSSMNHSSSHDEDISYTSNQTKLLVAETEATEDHTISTVYYEPRTISSHTTAHPALSFIKRITIERTFSDDDKEMTGLNKIELQPVAKMCDQKTYTTAPTALSELTQKPIKTVFKKICTAAVTPYKIAKELAFTENLTERTPSLTHWTPFMYKNEQFNLKPMLETKFTLLTNEIYANDHATKSHEPITQNIELKKFLRTTEEPETISLIPAHLFDPTPKNYIFKRVGTAMTTKANVVNNNIKHIVRSSAIQNNFLTKSLSTLTPPYSFVTDWANTNTNMNKNITEKHYLSFFSDLSKKHDNTKIISTTTQRKPIPTEVYNKLLQQQNTRKFEFNVAKLHVPPNFTNTYVQSTVSIVTEFNVNTYLLPSTSTTGRHSLVTESSTERTRETNKDVTSALYTTVIESPITKPSRYSKVLKNTMFTIAPELKQNTTNHWVYRFVNKYPVIVPRLDNIHFLPYTKGVYKESKAHKHWKSDHPPWVLHFWNKPHEDHDTLSLFPAKLRYRKLESTTEDAVVNFYFKKKINKLRPARPTMKVPTLPEIKRIKVVPLDTAHNAALIKTECTPTLRSYTSESYRSVTKKPLIKTHDRLLLREEARAKQMDEYILFMMRKTTTDTPNKKTTDLSAFKEDNWPTTFMKTVTEHNTPEIREEFPNYQDLMESLENEEQELEMKTHSKKNRRDLPKPHKTIIINRANVNDEDLIEISAEQKELRLLDDVDKLLQYYFPSTKPPKFVNLIARATAATTLLSPSLGKIIHKAITARKQKWRFDAVTRNDVNQNKGNRVVLIGRPRRNIIRKKLQ